MYSVASVVSFTDYIYGGIAHEHVLLCTNFNVRNIECYYYVFDFYNHGNPFFYLAYPMLFPFTISLSPPVELNLSIKERLVKQPTCGFCCLVCELSQSFYQTTIIFCHNNSMPLKKLMLYKGIYCLRLQTNYLMESFA